MEGVYAAAGADFGVHAAQHTDASYEGLRGMLFIDEKRDLDSDCARGPTRWPGMEW